MSILRVPVQNGMLKFNVPYVIDKDSFFATITMPALSRYRPDSRPLQCQHRADTGPVQAEVLGRCPVYAGIVTAINNISL